MMEANLRALLIGHAPLTALVPAARIVWNYLPQNTQRPAIVLFKIAGTPGLVLEGSDGLAASVVQIDVQATGVSSMWAIRDVLLALLHGHRDAAFDGIFLRTERQDSEELTGGTIFHRASLDLDIWAQLAA